jgi:photosystem II stability/assembly factor-like uncharacterized protein
MHQLSKPFAALALLAAAFGLCAQPFTPKLYQAMRWRQIGPFRAGRVTAVAGIPGNAAIYYMGTPGGGLWKTIDGGVVWFPIFDRIRSTSSIGAVSVAPSNPNIVYVGTGDVSMVGGSVNFGDGVYKSTDAGKTWQHIGLEETEHIGNLWIDPRDPNTVVVAALGRTYSKNAQRGIFKTTDGGKTWRQTLAKDDVTGAVDLAFAPGNPKVGYCAIMEHYTRPGARAAIESTGTAGVYKTTDGGDTWTQLTEGLPGGRLGRIGVATDISGQTVFAIVAGGGFGGGGGAAGSGGLYKSADGGAHWTRSTPDTRITGSGYFSRVFLDPRNSNVVYVAQTSLYRSDDGGKTFSSYKGAPGGDDNHALWIDPLDSDRMMMASDQGGTISMDGGKSWSSWYNQPTGQIYHLSTDNRYPYWVYGTQQDSGSVGTLSRGDYGAITFMDWDPVGGYEFGYIVPDPLNNNLVYAGGPSRGLVRIDRTNRQVATVSPAVGRGVNEYRMATNPPLAFSPQDGHVLYMGAQMLLETRDAGVHWKAISPDLTARKEPPPASEAAAGAPAQPGLPARPRAQEQQETIAPMNRAAINAFTPSPVAAGEIWVGTNNGIIQLTKDNGAHWQDVSPAGFAATTQISIVEASHFDANTAYAAVDRHEENDFRAHFYRTRDAGKTWQEISNGFADGDFARVVREDPQRKGLLYAGTENAAYVSFDEGDHWTSLQLNMPVSSVRDLVIHGDDLVAATYGRAFWVLDDVTPLRQIDGKTGATSALLFRPEKALRVRLDLNQDTPIPPDMPAGENPPNGAIIDFYLNAMPSQDVTMGIYDNAGKLVREYSTKPEAEHDPEPPLNVPDYWVGHPEPLTRNAGENRFVWDLRYAAPPVLRHEYPISALYANTPGLPLGAMVTPGAYKVRLTVNGRSYEQPLTVSMDPRVDVSNEALAQQLDLEQKIIGLVADSYQFYKKAVAFRQLLAGDQKELEKNPTAAAVVTALKEFDQKAARLQGADGGRGGGGGGGRGGTQSPAFAALNRTLGSLASVVDGQDAAPIPVMQTAYEGDCKELVTAVTNWNALMKTDLANLNSELTKQNLSPVAGQPMPTPVCK